MKLKNVFSYFLLAFIIATSFIYNPLQATSLCFKPGDKASYQITQKLSVEMELFDEKAFLQSESAIDVDFEVLSSDPLDVKVTLRRIHSSENATDQDGQKLIFNYDSKQDHVNECYLITQLMDQPMVFRIEGDFRTSELTSHLAHIYDKKEDANCPIFGTTPWSFELLLTQLFHLREESLHRDNSYFVQAYQFLNWEDAPLNEQENSIQQSSSYAIVDEDIKTIHGIWNGDAKVESHEKDYLGTVSLIGNVIWNVSNPLIQQRDLIVNIEEMRTGLLPIHTKMVVEQKWEPIP